MSKRIVSLEAIRKEAINSAECSGIKDTETDSFVYDFVYDFVSVFWLIHEGCRHDKDVDSMDEDILAVGKEDPGKVDPVYNSTLALLTDELARHKADVEQIKDRVRALLSVNFKAAEAAIKFYKVMRPDWIQIPGGSGAEKTASNQMILPF